MATAATTAASTIARTLPSITPAAPSSHPLAEQLPVQLLNFFKRYPPRLYSVHHTGQQLESLSEKIAREGNKKTGELPTRAAKSVTSSSQRSPAKTTEEFQKFLAKSEVTPATRKNAKPERAKSNRRKDAFLPNPFLPYKNPETGRWRGPLISLRRQADLFKLARKYEIEPLLPPSRKSSAYKVERLLQRGLAVKGTGEGQKVKGHIWERHLQTRLEKRITAMEGMPELIREWKARGYGRGWKKFPSGKAGS